MSDSRFYTTNPNDPYAPRVLASYYGLEPGMRVHYRNVHGYKAPAAVLVITELIAFGDALDAVLDVTAILNEGEYEVNADNLLPWEHRPPGDE